MKLISGLIYIISLIILSYLVTAADYYVDKDSLGGQCDDANPGTLSEPFCTFSEVLAQAGPGDSVYIREATYNEVLHVERSGAPGNYITYQAYPGETVTIDDVNSMDNGEGYGPIWLDHVSYIIVDGLTVTRSNGFGRAVASHHNIIRNSRFLGTDLGPTSKSKRGGFYFAWSSYNRIEDNYFFEGTDALAIINSNYTLIQGNEFEDAGHTCFTIKCGSNNVFRANVLYNQYEKTGEIFDCEDNTIDWHGNAEFREDIEIHDSTKRNLVEYNEFIYTPSSGDSSPYSGIQYAGQHGIIRRNIFRTTVGPGLSLTLYGDEAEYDHSNRVYNNVHYGSDFAGLSLSGSASYTFHDNIVKNNILAGSVFVANDQRWSWYTDELEGKPVQLMFGSINGFRLKNNNFWGSGQADEPYLITYGSRDSSSNPPQQTVDWWNQNHPDFFEGNKVLNPGFVDDAAYDFSLEEDSPMVDSGVFLTTTASAGSGTTIPVDDASYFYDGFGIPGEQGDIIQLEGETDMLRVVGIDYEQDEISLNESVSWVQGQGISLPYTGIAPDIGAFEFGLEYDFGGKHDPECVTEEDIMFYISRWKQGAAMMQDLIAAILSWKSGC